MASYLHTMYRITDPAKSREFYEALGFTFERDMDIVRDGEREATNYFFSIGEQKSVLELTLNHDGRSYELGTGYGHIALTVDDLDASRIRLVPTFVWNITQFPAWTRPAQYEYCYGKEYSAGGRTAPTDPSGRIL